MNQWNGPGAYIVGNDGKTPGKAKAGPKGKHKGLEIGQVVGSGVPTDVCWELVPGVGCLARSQLPTNRTA